MTVAVPNQLARSTDVPCHHMISTSPPLVGADLGIMDRETRKMREKRPLLFANIKEGWGTKEVRQFVEQQGGLCNPAV